MVREPLRAKRGGSCDRKGDIGEKKNKLVARFADVTREETLPSTELYCSSGKQDLSPQSCERKSRIPQSPEVLGGVKGRIVLY